MDTFLFLFNPASLTEGSFCEEVGTRIPTKWRVLGISLNIPTEKLDGFEKKHKSNSNRCFGAVFKAWKESSSPSVPFSWLGVVQALQTNFVGESTLAAELMKAHSIQEGNLICIILVAFFSLLFILKQEYIQCS